MAKIGLFYGSTTGNTETAAEAIQAEFGGDDVVELQNIADADLSELEEYDCLILGSPTWNIGELQSDWEGCFDELDDLDLSGKKVAYFGVGDQIGYADNFQDAMGILEEKVSSLGGQTVGHWPVDGYDFSESKAVKNGKFIGLALDDDNQDDLTEERIQKWVVQLKSEFGV
ncbi:flavodoxin FldA [Leptolyngbya valderiana BDU 20041]|nr:flavodoxin FldA [Geitlerinema sp. CS-897]OAB62172.1 flavodoxin FldA [Leptolyngbya valderiana BDU 20041]PPT08453.1 Flavodoxin 1 [Geitlerinema sp. FC II]